MFASTFNKSITIPARFLCCQMGSCPRSTSIRLSPRSHSTNPTPPRSTTWSPSRNYITPYLLLFRKLGFARGGFGFGLGHWFEINLNVPGEEDLDVGQLEAVEPSAEVIDDDLHQGRIGLLGVFVVSPRKIEPDEEIADQGEVLELQQAELSDLERPTIFFSKTCPIDLLPMLMEAVPS